MKRILNRFTLLRTLTVLLVATLGAATLPAIAVADVGRPNNAEVEIEHYYREFLLRPSDPGGYVAYRDRMWSDCKFGVLAAGMMIGDSAESHGKLRTPELFVRQMYRALLNRDADPGGLRTYVGAVRTRGYRWAIRDVQASQEFRNRLNAMCSGRRGSPTQNQLKPDEAVQAAVAMTNAGRTLIIACGVGVAITLTGALAAKSLYEASKAIKAATLAVGTAVNRGAVGACLSAYQVLQTANQIATIANYVPGAYTTPYNNPAYVYLQQSRSMQWNGRFCHLQMGAGTSADVRSWRQAKFRC